MLCLDGSFQIPVKRDGLIGTTEPPENQAWVLKVPRVKTFLSHVEVGCPVFPCRFSPSSKDNTSC